MLTLINGRKRILANDRIFNTYDSTLQDNSESQEGKKVKSLGDTTNCLGHIAFTCRLNNTSLNAYLAHSADCKTLG